MPVVSVRIPQLGEGLQEARLVEFLKNPGDTIKRDDPIYVMETDKAVTEVESPYAGKLTEWVVEENSVLPIGAEIARMEVAEGVEEMPIDHVPTSPTAAAPVTAAPTPSARGKTKPTGGVPIPPRTRKYLREKGLLDVADQIPAAGKKLMPDDVDRYLAGGEDGTAAGKKAMPADADYAESPLPQAQQTLNWRLKRGVAACVPATIAVDVDWTQMGAARAQTRETTAETAFSMMLWCVVQVMKQPAHASFRSTLSTDGKTLRTYHHVNLGVAVAIPGDLLRTAVVRHADALDRAQFRDALTDQIEKVRDGEDQIDATTTMTVSNIGSAQVQLGIPVVVKPAVATMALGSVQERAFPNADGGIEFRKVAALVLTFDHLIANGVGAAIFLNEVRERIESFQLEPNAVGA
jgi:pyruvate/2-oxoglutarate dehydrogenase complex dihydrolipoamide acyltransferase (E2) component